MTPGAVAKRVRASSAVILFVVDVYAPTHGVLTGGGIIAFFLGALMLFNRADPAFRLSLAYVIPATLITAAFFIFVIGAGVRAQRLPVRTGREAMLGKTVAATSPAAGPRQAARGAAAAAVLTRPVYGSRITLRPSGR